MNIESATVSLGYLATMLANFISFPYLIGSLKPEFQPLNFMWKFSSVIPKICIVIILTHPLNLTISRTEPSTVYLAWLTAKLAQWFLLASGIGYALTRTILLIFHPVFVLVLLSTSWAGLCLVNDFAFSVALARAILDYRFPIFHRNIGLFREGFATKRTAFC